MVKAISKEYEPLLKKEIDPYNNIVVTVGAAEVKKKKKKKKIKKIKLKLKNFRHCKTFSKHF